MNTVIKKGSPNQYKAMKLWLENSGSYPYYVKQEQERASEEGAPLDALYKSHEGLWISLSDLDVNHPFRAEYAAATKE